MAISRINVSTPSNEVIFLDSACGNSADGVKSSSALVYSITVDNSANGSSVFVKLWNLTSGSVVIGTSAPDQIILVPGSSVVTQTYFTGATPGVTFSTALSVACLTTGGTAGSTSPSSNVAVSINYV